MERGCGTLNPHGLIDSYLLEEVQRYTKDMKGRK